MKTDIEIARSHNPKPIVEIAKALNIEEQYIIPYGYDKAKISLDYLNHHQPSAKLVLVTAITPTKAGEGKTTTTIGLGDSLKALGQKVVLALREPSMGPVFGLKGGACGGGYAQVVPMEDINLHFTGDMHAITAANNLISACLDNHLYQGNQLQFDLNRIVFQRCLDMNDRALRNIKLGQKGRLSGVSRDESFNITVASEMMAILCLADSLSDLKRRVAKILLGYSTSGTPIYVKDLKIVDAVVVLLKQALHPNLVQTLEHTPAFVHGGPFANIAHGCNSLLATQMAMSLGDIVVTEAGFGADLGAEKFLDIKCPIGHLKPDGVVIVATIRALKLHGGVRYEDLDQENCEALTVGIANLEKHIETIQAYHLPYVIAINQFHGDTENEIETLKSWCHNHDHPCAVSSVFTQGSNGGIELAQEVLTMIQKPNQFQPLYQPDDDFISKVNAIAQRVYGARSVILSDQAIQQLEEIKKNGWHHFRVCMAKTPNSLSDNSKLLNRPKDFDVTIREIKVSVGAEFIVCLTGSILTMPGLPKECAAEKITIDDNGLVWGLS